MTVKKDSKQYACVKYITESQKHKKLRVISFSSFHNFSFILSSCTYRTFIAVYYFLKESKLSSEMIITFPKNGHLCQETQTLHNLYMDFSFFFSLWTKFPLDNNNFKLSFFLDMSFRILFLEMSYFIELISC